MSLSEKAQASDLTDIESILYLLTVRETERKMKGAIRPISIQRKCPICQNAFEEVSRLGFICKKHKTRPGKFYLDITYQKKRYPIFRDEKGEVLDSYAQARSLLHKINTDIENDCFDPATYIRSEKEKFYLINRWENYCEREYSKKYRKSLRYAKGHIFRFFKSSQDIRNLEQKHIQLFFEELIHEVPSLGTTKGITAVLNAFLNYNQSIGLIKNKFSMPRTDRARKVKRKQYIPTLQESLKIISFIPESERDIYLFLLTHGCRPNEARAVQAGDLNFTDATVTVQRGFSGNELHDLTKTGHEYTVPIHAALFEKLKQICINKMPVDFVFAHKGKAWSETRIYRVWKDAAIKAGLPRISNYAGVKHSSASEIATKTGDIYNTSKFLGHRGGIQNTMKYTERRDIEKLRKLQAKLIIPGGLISR